MKTMLSILISMMFLTEMTLVNFKPNSNLSNWRVVDDVVMGGRSNGSFSINEAGNAVFQGTVSLENNGGFSSVRYSPESVEMTNFDKIMIHLKGDGKQYQFRLKSNRFDRHSYIYNFETTGDWETITVTMNEMKPSFRGMALDMDNYPSEKMEELAFLIGNKRPETFKLEIDKIVLH